MDRATRFDLAARALATTIVHASVAVPLVLFWTGLFTVLGGVLVFFGVGLLIFFGLPDAYVIPLMVVLTATVTVYGLYSVTTRIRRRVQGGREQLLERVAPAEVVGDEEPGPGVLLLAALGDERDPTDATVRERMRELLGNGQPDGGADGDVVVDASAVADRFTDSQRDGFVRTVRRLATLADVPWPTLGVHPSAAPLCYTVHHEGHVFLVVSRGLLGALPDGELEAVLAHEVAHLANGDHRFMTWATVPLIAVEESPNVDGAGETERATTDSSDSETKWMDRLLASLLVLVPYAALRVWFLDVHQSEIHPLVGVVDLIFVLLGGVTLLAVLYLSPVLALVVLVGIAYKAALIWAEFGTGLFSRGREFAADRAGVHFTGDPGALANALERLDDTLADRPPEDLRDHVHTRDALNVVPSLDPEHDGGGGLLATHPATETRIERLRELEREQETV